MAYIKSILVNMLEQRRAQEKGYITLKEAAKISNYTPDYVGQLIRAGKIQGEQVYCNVAWVTTPEEIDRYVNRRTKSAAPTQLEVGFIQDLQTHRLWLVLLYISVVTILFSLVFFQDARASSSESAYFKEIDVPQTVPSFLYEN